MVTCFPVLRAAEHDATPSPVQPVCSGLVAATLSDTLSCSESGTDVSSRHTLKSKGSQIKPMSLGVGAKLQLFLNGTDLVRVFLRK